MLGGSIEFEWKATYYNSLRAKLILASLEMKKNKGLALDEPQKNVIHSNLHILTKHPLHTYQPWKVFYANKPTPNQKLS